MILNCTTEADSSPDEYALDQANLPSIELIKACNHITCECGNSFCYICGKDWPGSHGCPRYSPVHYDEEGDNQLGFHKEIGLNREGLAHRQQMLCDGGEEDSEEDGVVVEEWSDDEDEGENGDEDALQHINDERRTMINNLDPAARGEALLMLRIELFQLHGITFNHPQFNVGPPQVNGVHDDEEQEEEGEEGDEVGTEQGNEEEEVEALDDEGKEGPSDGVDGEEHDQAEEKIEDGKVAN